jgi:RNA polymerase sigma factor (sigma-70 family)
VTAPPEEQQRLARLWTEHAPRVLAYASRHVDPESAQDIVSETFLTAWRRRTAVPDDPLPWLLVVARNTIANQHRSGRRRARLTAEMERLHHLTEPAATAADVLATERAAVLAGLAALTPLEREALLLIAWDGLDPAQAARVAGCSLPTFHVRLFRARRRLQSGAGSPAVSPRPLASPGGTA